MIERNCYPPKCCGQICQKKESINRNAVAKIGEYCESCYRLELGLSPARPLSARWDISPVIGGRS